MKLAEKWEENDVLMDNESNSTAASIDGPAKDGSVSWHVYYPPGGESGPVRYAHIPAAYGLASSIHQAQRDARAKLEQLHREAGEREGKVVWSGMWAKVNGKTAGSVAYQHAASCHLSMFCDGLTEKQAREVFAVAIAKKLELENAK